MLVSKLEVARLWLRHQAAIERELERTYAWHHLVRHNLDLGKELVMNVFERGGPPYLSQGCWIVLDFNYGSRTVRALSAGDDLCRIFGRLRADSSFHLRLSDLSYHELANIYAQQE